jgi:lysozyme family protein
MTGNFEQCLALVLKAEGGFVDNKNDPGGMTNLGVTKATWEAYVGHEVDEATMRALGLLKWPSISLSLLECRSLR